MLHALKQRRDDEEGFTLIELMVVVLIIAILLAIAIPTFLGARERAQDRAAQSNLRNGLTAEKVFYTDAQAYTVDDNSGPVKAIEPSLTFATNGAVDTVGTVYTHTTTNSVTNDTVILGAKSASGKCFYLKDIATATSTQNAGTFYAQNTTCTAPGSTTVSGAKW